LFEPENSIDISMTQLKGNDFPVNAFLSTKSC
jgi:hypothetical protein